MIPNTKTSVGLILLIADFAPNAAEKAIINKVGKSNLIVRNASQVGETDKPEKAEAVTATSKAIVPKAYASYKFVQVLSPEEVASLLNPKAPAKPPEAPTAPTVPPTPPAAP